MTYREWHEPIGVWADKPANFDEMVEAAATAAKACTAAGYTHGDKVTITSCFRSAEAAYRYGGE